MGKSLLIVSARLIHHFVYKLINSIKKKNILAVEKGIFRVGH